MGMTMRKHLKLILPPTEAPVTLQEVKEHLRVEGGHDDAAIVAMIEAAVEALDGPAGFLGQCIQPQTWALMLDRFPPREIAIPLGPVSSIVSITYTNQAGLEAVVPAADYELDGVGTFAA
jgi:uncharacterized phiE125 gp8 family phage protein